jgi:hypothetical protein
MSSDRASMITGRVADDSHFPTRMPHSPQSGFPHSKREAIDCGISFDRWSGSPHTIEVIG